nr:erythropoietin isoform X2 [Caretta caretta]
MGSSGLCALPLLLLGLAALTCPSPLHPICDARVMEKFIKEARDTENAMVRSHPRQPQGRGPRVTRPPAPEVAASRCRARGPRLPGRPAPEVAASQRRARGPRVTRRPAPEVAASRRRARGPRRTSSMVSGGLVSLQEGCTNSCNLSEVLTVPDTKVNFNEWKKMDRQTQAAEVWGGQALLSAAVLRARDLVPDPSLSQQLGRTYSNLRGVTQILRSHNAQVEPALPPAPPPTLGIQTLAKLLSVHSNFLRGRVKLFLTDACRPDTR